MHAPLKNARPTKRTASATYEILNANEGGMGRPFALSVLRGAGITATPAKYPSPLHGHSSIVVRGGAKVQQKAERLLFGEV
jgi:hypothetical protein